MDEITDNYRLSVNISKYNDDTDEEETLLDTLITGVGALLNMVELQGFMVDLDTINITTEREEGDLILVIETDLLIISEGENNG